MCSKQIVCIVNIHSAVSLISAWPIVYGKSIDIMDDVRLASAAISMKKHEK